VAAAIVALLPPGCRSCTLLLRRLHLALRHATIAPGFVESRGRLGLRQRLSMQGGMRRRFWSARLNMELQGDPTNRLLPRRWAD